MYNCNIDHFLQKEEKKTKKALKLATVLLTAVMFTAGCQGVSSEEKKSSGRDLKQVLIEKMEKKYDDKFTVIENAGGGSGMSEHCAVFVSSEKLPDDRIYAVHGIFDGKSSDMDNYMAYYLRKDADAYLTKLAGEVYGECKAFCKPEERSLLPDNIGKSSSAAEMLRSTKMYYYVFLPPQDTADKEEKLDRMYEKLRTEKLNCYFYIAYLNSKEYYTKMDSFEGTDKSEISTYCTLGMDDGFNIVERQWGNQ